MKRISLRNKKNIVLTLTVLLVLAGGIAYIVSAQLKEESRDPYSSELTLQIANPDKALPKGTVSPTQIIAKPTEYTDKELLLRGVVVEPKKGEYYLQGQESSNRGSVRLDVGKNNIDIAKLTTSGSADYESGVQAPKPVTLEGSLSKELIFVVTSVR
jgi:hypothetical protein